MLPRMYITLRMPKPQVPFSGLWPRLSGICNSAPGGHVDSWPRRAVEELNVEENFPTIEY